MPSTHSTPRYSPIEIEQLKSALLDGYRAFYHHGLEQLSSLSESNGMLRFSAVTMQVALELFLKYYFVVIGEADEITDDKKHFIIFSKILGKYIDEYHQERRVAQSGELRSLLTARNRIVHSGAFGAWDQSLAKQIVTCAFFIQQLSGNEQLDSPIPRSYELHKQLAENPVWKRGAGEVALELAVSNEVDVLLCPFCSTRSLLPQDVLTFSDESDELNWNCLTCLETLMHTHHGEMTRCPSCHENTFWVDTLNKQPNNHYCGKCLDCDTPAQVLLD